jgi:hypothetical protein
MAKQWVRCRETFVFNGNGKTYVENMEPLDPSQLIRDGWTQVDIDTAIGSYFAKCDPPVVTPVQGVQPKVEPAE